MNLPVHQHSTEDEHIALTAAEWFFLLRSAPSPADQAAFVTWRAADPRHERAWQKAERIGKTLAGLPPELALPTLGRGCDESRRRAIKTLAALLCATPAAWLAWHSAPARERLADVRTATGEQRLLTLADGTRLHLNTATAVDIVYDDSVRLLKLHTGEILVETAPDKNRLPRPLLVTTAQGTARALGTRFTVRVGGERSRIAVYEGAVEVRPAAAQGRYSVLHAGQQAHFSATAADTAQEGDPHGADWSQGRLVVHNMPLAEFAAELSRYRPGILRCDPAIADLRVSGTFWLHDTGPILASLARAMPVQVHYRTRYWVTLVAAQEPA